MHAIEWTTKRHDHAIRRITSCLRIRRTRELLHPPITYKQMQGIDNRTNAASKRLSSRRPLTGEHFYTKQLQKT